jgi:hypothetical protein
MTEMVVRVTDDSIDPVQLDELVDELRQEILTLPVSDVRLASTPGPPGARGQALDLAVIVVQLALETGLVRAVADRIRGWSRRHRVSEVEVVLGDSTLVLSQATEAQQQEIIEHFIDATSSS